jgi:Tol biopolymer transport system component
MRSNRLITVLLVTMLFLNGCDKHIPVGHEGIIPPDYNDDMDPDWSPDGRIIAFTHHTVYGDTSGGPFGIHFINLDGTNRRIFLLNAHSPDWSPDGSKLAFVLGGQICIINIDSTDFKSLGIEGFFPDWSPDGLKIAYDIGEGGHTYVVDFSRSGQPQKYLDNAWEPAWSPDGQYLAFCRHETPYSASSIYVANVDGTGAIQLAKPISELDFHHTPCYSHVGNKIAYSTSKRGLSTIDSNGANMRILDRSGIHPSWSSDDQLIVFSGSTDIPGRSRLFIIYADGSGLKQLTF